MELDIIKRFKMSWLVTNGKENKVIENLLGLLNKELIPQKLHLAEAKELLKYNKHNEIKDYLIEALKHSFDVPQLAEIHYILSCCFYAQGLLDEALAHLDTALQLEADQSDYWNLKADCLLELGEWEGAVNCLNRSLRSSPGDAKTVYRLGSIFLFHGQYGEALDCFCGCCKLEPFNPEYLEMKAEMLIKLDQFLAAAECFRIATRYGGQIHLFSRLAYCYAKTGQIKKAKKLFIKTLKLEPDNYDALCNLAGIYHKLDRDELAYKLLLNAYSINCNDPLLLNNLAYISFKLGRSRKALEYYHDALKIDPTDPIVLYNYGACLSEKGIWDDARIALERLVSLESNNYDAWALLGNIYEQLSKHKKAVDCFNKALGLLTPTKVVAE